MYEPTTEEVRKRVLQLREGEPYFPIPTILLLRAARLELIVEETLARLSRAAVVPCAGECGRAEPVLQDSRYGQRSHISEWICPACHRKVCNADVTASHDCKALRE